MTSIKYAHLQVMGTITGKFNQNHLKTVGGDAETRLCLRTDGLTDGWTDEPITIVPFDKRLGTKKTFLGGGWRGAIELVIQQLIRLLHLIRVCTISYSAVLNKHERKYGDDSILNMGPKYSRIHCVSRSYCYILSGSTQIFYFTFSIYIAKADTTAVWCPNI